MQTASELKRQLFALCEAGTCPDCGVAAIVGNKKAASIVCTNCGQRWSVELNGMAWGDDDAGGSIQENDNTPMDQRA